MNVRLPAAGDADIEDSLHVYVPTDYWYWAKGILSGCY